MKAHEIDNFDELLENAEGNAKNDWEMEFMDGIREKYERYGLNMFVSEKQLEVLEKIANY